MCADPSTLTGRKRLRLSLLDEELRAIAAGPSPRSAERRSRGAASIEVSDPLKDPWDYRIRDPIRARRADEQLLEVLKPHRKQASIVRRSCEVRSQPSQHCVPPFVDPSIYRGSDPEWPRLRPHSGCAARVPEPTAVIGRRTPMSRRRSRDCRRCSTLRGVLKKAYAAWVQLSHRPKTQVTRGTTFALSRPGLTFCLNPIAGQSRATHRDQHRAHPVWTPRDRIRLGVDQEWLTHPIPSH
jgi:hypothetical protein